MIRVLFASFVLCIATMTLSTRGQATQPATGEKNEFPTVYLKATERIGDVEIAFTMKFETPKEKPVDLSGKIELHGAASRNYLKKSYGLSLDQAFSPLGMTRSKRWVLNAAFIDRSLMRHKLSYDLFLSLAKPGARRPAAASRFVEVFLNGDYVGVYLLMERVDGKLLGLLDSLPTDAEHACLYKAVNHDANFAKAGHTGFEQKEPDPDDLAYWKPLDDLHDFILKATPEQFMDPMTGIGSRMDLDNAIDFHLLVQLTGNLDGITKNFFLGRDLPLNGSAPKFFMAPWDYDGTFGRHWNATKTSADFWLSNNLYNKLMADPGYKKRFDDRWRELREKQFSVKTLSEMIDANVATLGKAADRNAARWEPQAGVYPDKLTLEEDVAEMKEWVAKRVAFLDKRILDGK